MLHSVLTIGRELRYPLDITLNALLPLAYHNAESIISFLPLTYSNRFFASEILKILVEDRRATHTEQVNSNKNAIQSGKAKDKVAKLSYTVLDSFQIIRGLGRGSYIVQKLNKSDSPELSFISEELYMLPPNLKSFKPIDISHIRYLSQSHTLIVDSL